AVNALIEGATFIDTFRELHHRHGFGPRAAFLITVRVFRGGGLTKDLLYLKGIRDLLTHLSMGGELEPLFIGKIGLSQLPVIEDIRMRQEQSAPARTTSYMGQKAAMDRLEASRGMALFELVRKGEN